MKQLVHPSSKYLSDKKSRTDGPACQVEDKILSRVMLLKMFNDVDRMR